MNSPAEAIVQVWEAWPVDGEASPELDSVMRAAIEQFPECSMLWTMLGELVENVDLGSWSDSLEVEECFKKALTLNPKCARAACDLGYWLDIVDRLEEARGYLELSLDLAPSGDALAGWLRVMAQLGKADEAAERARRDFAAVFEEPEVQHQIIENAEHLWHD
ncbi:MAG: hypothetical protein KDA20_11525 [Phycisphaerales bacterium]|nr:hypothetical protein [Phycisphaerales bacterium]